MGNQCCQDHHLMVNSIDNIDKKYLARNFTNQYQESQLPKDSKIIETINNIKMQPQFKGIIEKSPVFKHKSLDRYFMGNLSEKYYPLGLGILYQPQNFIYHGEFNCVPSGNGKIQLFKQGIIYTGMFKAGKAEGQGRIDSKDKRVEFQGIMKNSFPSSGTLKIYHQNEPSKSCQIQFENFPNEKVKVMYGDGRMYEGPINQSTFVPEGKGIGFYPDNSHYEGQFLNGEIHGKGSFYWSNGCSYHGDYHHGKKHGNGTFNYSSRRYYEGEWLNGKQHGQGVLYEGQCKVIRKGIWSQGNFDRQQ